jgi:hypothetical protein
MKLLLIVTVVIAASQAVAIALDITASGGTHK